MRLSFPLIVAAEPQIREQAYHLNLAPMVMLVTRSGILWLTVNDDAPEGNVGEFNVRITIVKKKR